MFQKYEGLIFLIDAGLSRGIDLNGQGYSKGALLHIRGGTQSQVRAIYPDGDARQLWP